MGMPVKILMRSNRVVIVGAVLALIAAFGASGLPATGQADRSRLFTDIEEALNASDFAEVGRLGRQLLDATPDPAGPEAAFALASIAASEIVAGRNADAFGNLRRAYVNLIQASCRDQKYYFRPAYGIAGTLATRLPQAKLPLVRAVLEDVCNSIGTPEWTTGSLSRMAKGMRVAIASVLSTLCLVLGDAPAAEDFANAALYAAPAIEPGRDTLREPYSCGCIKGPSSQEPADRGWMTAERFHNEEVRANRVLCGHPLNAMALLAVIQAAAASTDPRRLGNAARDVEELLDRSEYTGSLLDYPEITKALGERLEAVRRSHPELWPPPKVSRPVSIAEVETDPALSPGTTVVVREFSKISKNYTIKRWYLHVRAQRPPKEKESRVIGTWWIYRWEDGALRLAGRAVCNAYPAMSADPLDLRIERLTFRDQYWSGSVGEFEYKKKVLDKVAQTLGRFFVSLELLGADVDELSEHRRDMFSHGLPWLGMPQKLVLLSMPMNHDAGVDRSLAWYRESGGIMNWTVYYTDYKVSKIIPRNRWKGR